MAVATEAVAVKDVPPDSVVVPDEESVAVADAEVVNRAELLEDAVSAAEGVVEEVRVTAADADAGDVAVDTTDTDAVKAADRLWGADAV